MLAAVAVCATEENVRVSTLKQTLSLHSKSRDLIPFGSFPSRTEENADKTTGDGVKEENEIILSVKALLLFLL